MHPLRAATSRWRRLLWFTGPGLVMALVLTWSSHASALVLKNGDLTRQAARIEAPNTVAAGRAFNLCGPAMDGATYSWTGSGLSASSGSRCVQVHGLRAGNYDYELRVQMPSSAGKRGGIVLRGAVSTFRARVTVLDSTYQIFGPGVVGVGVPFELCATAGDGLTYLWDGPNLPVDRTTRCVSVGGLGAGSYTFSVEITDTTGTTTVSHVVLVSTNSGYSITGPTEVLEGQTFTLCASEGIGLTYLWNGTALPDDSTTRCVEVGPLTPGTYTYTVAITDSFNTTTLAHTVTVNPATAYFITGPDSVDVGQPFQLCASPGGTTYMWTGENITSNPASMCIDVGGLEAGIFTYTVTITDSAGTTILTHDVQVGPDTTGGGPPDTVTCVITGPSTVLENHKFTLCGPEGDNLRYRWEGPCGFAPRSGRCLNVRGLRPGTFTFTLTLCFTSDSPHKFEAQHGRPRCDSTETCSFTVTVVEDTVETPCPASLATWRERFFRVDDPEWREQLEAIAACIDENTESVSWNDDLAGLRAALSPRSRHHDVRGLIQAQFFALAANVCAAELGARDPITGRLLGIMSGTPIDCHKVEFTTVDALLAHLDELMEECNGSLRGESGRRLSRLGLCIAGLNGGKGSDCKKGHKHDDDDDHGDDDDDHGDDDDDDGGNGKDKDKDKKDKDKKDKGKHLAVISEDECRAMDVEDELALGQASEASDEWFASLAGVLDMERPSPNPFRESTRLQYVVAAGGGDVEIGVFDLAGRRIARLAHGRQEAGTYEVRWNGTRDGGGRVLPGVYFLRGVIGQRTMASRIMYLR